MKNDIWDDFGYLDENFDGEVDNQDAALADEFDEEMAQAEAERRKKRAGNYDEDIDGDDLDDIDEYDEEETLAEYDLLTDSYLDDEEAEEEAEEYDEEDSEEDEQLSPSPLDQPKQGNSLKVAKRYYDEYMNRWDFKQALIDKYPELAIDYQDNDDANLFTIIYDTYGEDKSRFLRYIEWLWAYFPYSLLGEDKHKSYHTPSYDIRGYLIHELLCQIEGDSFLYNLLKSNKNVLKATFKDCLHENHSTALVKEYMLYMFYNNDADAAIMVYKHYLAGQSGRYTQRDLGKLWHSVVQEIKWHSDTDGDGVVALFDKILPLVREVEQYGAKAIAEIEKYKTEWEEEKREEEEERREEEEEDAVEEEVLTWKERQEKECLEEERLDRAVQPIIVEAESIIIELVTNGEYYDKESVDDTLYELCFKDSDNKYSTLCHTLLLEYGAVERIGKGLKKGVIPANKLEDIYMLLSATYAITNYLYCENKDEPPTSAADFMTKQNAPIVNYIINHNRFAKLYELEVKAHQIGVRYFQRSVLNIVHKICGNSQDSQRAKAKELYAQLLATRKLKYDSM